MAKRPDSFGRPKPGGAKTDAQRAREYRRRQRMKATAIKNNTPADWVPEMPGQRPPFGPGNLAGMRHGANVASIPDPVAQKLIDWVVNVPGNEYLRDERNAMALHDWGHAQARVLLMQAYADGRTIEEALSEVTLAEETEQNLAPGHVRRLSKVTSQIATWKALESAEKHARQAADRLGLSPLARMKLGKQAQSQSADLALVWSAQDDGEPG